MAVVALADDDDDANDEALSNLRLFRARMSLKERHYLTSKVLVPPNASPWIVLYGRPPKLPHKHQALAPVLHYCTAAFEHKTMCEIFGVPPSTFATAFRKAQVAFGIALESIDQARVHYPSKRTQMEGTASGQTGPLVSGQHIMEYVGEVIGKDEFFWHFRSMSFSQVPDYYFMQISNYFQLQVLFSKVLRSDVNVNSDKSS
ncbi:hypothetical protein H257_14279 [Aphanomyces astaci]|uniref:DDE Tnp4 domain-containing protein n=1 Tax=Aphanomyces astaci TaxID=112090 RepID=W4FRK2_APHAT|nr:hypothetical protein H257_14279 [Aphanomyces astaci]ETV70120.1 hypothetical protein H257_14279 [Aphanomyces astaci]|eukprot:XP_009840351.1 hypothetical protein H257_14279 [Aphanomyces astaci]